MRKLLIVFAAAALACQPREGVQSEAQEEALPEDAIELPAPCDLSGQWDVEETVSGGTCEDERLVPLPLRIAIDDQGASLVISVTRGQTVFEACSGKRALEACATNVTCSPAEDGDVNAELELTVAPDGRLSGHETLTYRNGREFCNVELELEGTPGAPQPHPK